MRKWDLRSEECTETILEAVELGYRLIDTAQMYHNETEVGKDYIDLVLIHQYMKKYGVQHESWEPFAEGRKDFFTNPVLAEIGNKYGKTSDSAAFSDSE